MQSDQDACKAGVGEDLGGCSSAFAASASRCGLGEEGLSVVADL